MIKLRFLLAILFMALVGSGIARAAELGDDGLHKQPWFLQSFLTLADDVAEAEAAGKRLVVIFEQRGCP